MSADSLQAADSRPPRGGPESSTPNGVGTGGTIIKRRFGFGFNFGNKKLTDAKLPDNAFYWLAALVLFAQLPHLFHLPWWVSICGVLLVLLWIAIRRHPNVKVLALLRDSHALAFIALAGAVAVRLHYGYIMGRDPSVALLFLLTACKFAETRQPKDASLLVCLCGFLLLTQYFYSQTLIAGLVTIPAVVAIGGAFLTLAQSGGNTQAMAIGPTLKSVCVLLMQGLPIAALLFVLFPRLPGPLWNLPSDANAVTGLSDSMSPGSIASLSQSHAVAFRVEFDDKIPAKEDLYWRGPVLSDFDGRGWSQAQRTPLRQPQSNSVAPENEFSYTVTLPATQQNWLFAIDNPTSLPRAAPSANTIPDNTQTSGFEHRILGRMTDAQQLLSPKPLSRGIRYRVSSSAQSSFVPHRDAEVGLTQISGRNSEAMKFARQQRSNSGSNSEYVSNILGWFRSQPFHYTLQPPLLGDAPVDEFLFDSKRGFCEHYASAFTYLMRAVGIPSRVVTGYQGGEMNGDYMIVRQSDAHAWSEVWLNGSWQRIDPTATVSPSRIEQGISSMPAGEPVPLLARTSSNRFRELQLRWDRVNHNWQKLFVEFDRSRQNALWSRIGLPKPTALQLVLLILALAAVWTLFLVGQKPAIRKPADAAEKIWLATLRLYKKRGVEIAPSETSSRYTARLKAAWPEQAALIEQHFQRLDMLRFGRLSAPAREELLKAASHSRLDLQKVCTKVDFQQQSI